MLVGTDPRTAAGVVCLRAPVAGGSIIMGRRGHQRMVSRRVEDGVRRLVSMHGLLRLLRLLIRAQLIR
jgi:hypothetical protein